VPFSTKRALGDLCRKKEGAPHHHVNPIGFDEKTSPKRRKRPDATDSGQGFKEKNSRSLRSSIFFFHFAPIDVVFLRNPLCLGTNMGGSWQIMRDHNTSAERPSSDVHR